jgi:ssDNA-binding Zn-finger/Zn-ribbon topoisomerase 1|tara:strand:+ start:711 stop:2378 length:1668 start_codon:yes stop_codon:yes gene_type:complete
MAVLPKVATYPLVTQPGAIPVRRQMNLSDFSIHHWIKEHGMKTETGVPLDFDDHLFMYDIYSDFSPKMVCKKAAQITFTTMMIFKLFYIAQKKKMDVIYTLPTGNDVKDVVGAKINRIIDNNPVLQEYIDRDSVEQKRVGNSVVYFRGTMTTRAALSISSDWNIYDELDRSDMNIVDQYSTRLQHSKYQWESYFSNPSVPGHGVDRYWERSDQKHWFIKCGGCKEEQYLDFPESICFERKVYQCKSCHKALTRKERRLGRWVAKYKDKEFSGYWISLLMAPWVSAAEIIEKYETKPRDQFDNFVLGLEHHGSGNSVSEETIMQNVTSEVNTQEGRIVMGLDTGLTLWYVVGNKDGIFYHNSAESYDEIESLLRRYPKMIIVADAHGDLIKIRELQEKYQGRIYLCYYSVDSKHRELIRWGEKKDHGIVHVDRNRMIQFVIDEFTTKRIALNGTYDEWFEFSQHYKNLYRMAIENKRLGIMERRWEHNGPDHYAHATSYWRTGMNKFADGGLQVAGTVPIDSFQKGVEVDYDGSLPREYTKGILLPDKNKHDWRNG